MTQRIPAAFFGTLVVACLLPGCRHPADPERLEALDGLLGQVDSLEHTLDAMDTVELAHASVLYAAERTAIEARFKDTLAPQVAVVLGNYHRAMARTLPLALDEHRYTRAALDSTRIRLAHLRHDITRGLLKEEEESSFIAQEHVVVNDLAQRVGAVGVRLHSVQEDRTRFRAQADSILRDTLPHP